jgi:hypothetical protein
MPRPEPRTSKISEQVIHQSQLWLLICSCPAHSQTLPLFLDRLADPFTAVIVSVTVVLTFGAFMWQLLRKKGWMGGEVSHSLKLELHMNESCCA